MFYRLPPAGHRIQAASAAWDKNWFNKTFLPLTPYLFGSGAQALSAAILAIRRVKCVPMQPEVILPAYTCPELVSAVLYAGAIPRLVDLAPERPWLDLTAVKNTISPATIAIIGVNLFGIRERWDALVQIAHHHKIPLIEDSAQLFPPRDEVQHWSGDLVVLSFGRGKPVSALTGGAVFATSALYKDPLQTIAASTTTSEIGQTKILLQRHAYNLFRLPRLYWLASAIPWLHLGETRFHPILGLQRMADAAQRLLPDNIRHYWAHPARVEQQLRNGLAKANLPDVIDLPIACGVTNIRLNRYPLFITNPAKRNEAMQRLSETGLGASCLYPATLPHIPGLEDILANTGKFPNATRFAQSLLTLPTHESVTTRDIEKILEILTRTLYCR